MAVPSHNKNESIPLVIILRDILKIINTKKELKKILNEKQILINQKLIRDTNYPVNLFDILTIVREKKNYSVILSEFHKFEFKEISDEQALKRVYKILNKKILSQGKIQLNLMQGRSVISDKPIKTNDSIILNLKNNNIEKIISLEKGSTGYAFKGKHTGISGKILDIINQGGKKLAILDFNSDKVNVWIKNLIVIK